jgi:SAM-dependent methyltransferase
LQIEDSPRVERPSPPLSARDVVTSVASYYAEKLSAHGKTARGVDWSSEESQQLRFDELLRIVRAAGKAYTLLDYGCGYGALAERLIAEGGDFGYVGFDVCTPMVQAARAAMPDPRCRFTAREEDLRQVDYTVASGIFNVKLQASEDRWEAHVEATLTRFAKCSRDGFAFNMLTRYADTELMRDYLYYADPAKWFGLCKERFSRNVALLHDYDLYEFTILVRLGTGAKPLAR